MVKKLLLYDPKNKTRSLLLLEPNYDKIFLFLEQSFPSWASWEGIKQKLEGGGIHEEDIVSLYELGFLDVMKEGESVKIKDGEWKKEYKEGIPDLKKVNFRLSPKGFEYLNNIYSREINKGLYLFNKTLLKLTLIITILAIVQTFSILFQILFLFFG